MNPLAKVLAGLLAVAAIIIGVQQCQKSALAEEHRAAALRADSIQAAADTTRLLAMSGALGKLFGDSLQAFQRRIIQAPQIYDAIDEALKKHGVEQRRALALIALRLDSLKIRQTSPTPTTEDSAGTRRASFPIDSTPFRGRVEVELPKPPAPATIDLRLGVDPINLDVRIGCGSENADGIRPATINAVAPRWATVAFPTVTADPGVCQTPPRSRWYDAFFAGPGVGVLVTPGGQVYGGGTFSLGYDLLPLLRKDRR